MKDPEPAASLVPDGGGVLVVAVPEVAVPWVLVLETSVEVTTGEVAEGVNVASPSSTLM